jgi:hypothetical protein
MAGKDPFHGKIASFEEPVLFECYDAILRAGGCIAAFSA